MTDPQIPCRPTQHATEICADCRTPAGRLVTVLAALGIEAKAEGDEEVTVDGYAVAIDDDGNWNIRDYTGEVDAETAIAAIVQAPGLRARADGFAALTAATNKLIAERDTLAAEVQRLREELEKPVAEPWEHGRCVRWCGHAEVADVDINGFVGWTVYRDRVAVAHGPESGAAGRHAADLALVAAGYRLVGGVHPLPDEVQS